MIFPKDIWRIILDKLRPIDYYHMLLTSKSFHPTTTYDMKRHVEMMKDRYYETRNHKIFSMVHPHDPYWLPFSYRHDTSSSFFFSLRPPYTKISKMIHRYWCSTHTKVFIIKKKIGFYDSHNCCDFCCNNFRFEDIKLSGWAEPLLITNS